MGDYSIPFVLTVYDLNLYGYLWLPSKINAGKYPY